MISIGDKFGRLTVVALSTKKNTKRPRYRFWDCACDCGGTRKGVWESNLLRGATQSCGCLFVEVITKVNKRIHTTHGESNKNITIEYQAWGSMIDRCYKIKDYGYKSHGARGIKVYKPWHEYKNFLKYLLEGDKNNKPIGRRPGEGYSLDRIDNEGNYEPGNIRWATWEQQNNNRRNCKEYWRKRNE